MKMKEERKERKGGGEGEREGERGKERKEFLNQIRLGIAEFNKLIFIITGFLRTFKYANMLHKSPRWQRVDFCV